MKAEESLGEVTRLAGGREGESREKGAINMLSILHICEGSLYVSLVVQEHTL